MDHYNNNNNNNRSSSSSNNNNNNYMNVLITFFVAIRPYLTYYLVYSRIAHFLKIKY